MYCNEEESKKKWCPMSRLPGYTENPGGWNRCMGDNQITETMCLASGCMMWRWIWPPDMGVHDENGYCGLGGKPE